MEKNSNRSKKKFLFFFSFDLLDVHGFAEQQISSISRNVAANSYAIFDGGMHCLYQTSISVARCSLIKIVFVCKSIDFGDLFTCGINVTEQTNKFIVKLLSQFTVITLEKITIVLTNVNKLVVGHKWVRLEIYHNCCSSSWHPSATSDTHATLSHTALSRLIAMACIVHSRRSFVAKY